MLHTEHMEYLFIGYITSILCIYIYLSIRIIINTNSQQLNSIKIHRIDFYDK